MSGTPDDEPSLNSVEVRLFGSLYEFAADHDWPSPLVVQLTEECSAAELARAVGIPVEQIEGIFIDGKASPFAGARVKPGNRVGFIPYGIPGIPAWLLSYRRPPSSPVNG